MCAPYVVRANLMTEAEIHTRGDWFRSVVAGEKERIRTYAELPERIAYLFVDETAVPYEEVAEKNSRKHEGRIETLRAYLDWIRPQLETGVDVPRLREAGKAWMVSRGLKPPQLLQPLRCALTGQAGGPDIYEVIGWLGAARSLRRIEMAIERLA
jgi:nondiscriminating glutamyl-tRNA synthetase